MTASLLGVSPKKVIDQGALLKCRKLSMTRQRVERTCTLPLVDGGSRHFSDGRRGGMWSLGACAVKTET